MGFQEGIMSNYKRILSILAAAALAFTACGGAASGKAVKETDHQPSIYIKAVEGITDDAIRGMDLSATGSMFDSFDALNEGLDTPRFGYRDYDGNLLDRQGFFDFLAANGVNYARLRVWNDPKDSQGRYYGGGNNDIDRAIELGTYATKAGMKVMIDFHYSDFWADPAKQMEPKAWEGKEPAEKASLLSDFTTESLTALIDAGVDVGIVQIGNETNGMIAGVKGGGNWRENMNLLFDAGCDAVHAVAAEKKKDILAAVHFTNPEDSDRYMGYAEKLADFDSEGDGEKEGVSYDIFASSYYPYWHGTLSNLTRQLKDIAEKYDKKVMVAETSYIYTLKDHDGTGNTENPDKTGDVFDYDISPQGQADLIRAVAKAVLDTGENGIGMFWWEPAWIPVNYYDEASSDAAAVYEKNAKIWEEKGSGWATKYAIGYDKDADAYGGSAVDNEAWFDGHGHALPSVNAYRYLRTGASLGKGIERYASEEKPSSPEVKLSLPDGVENLLLNPGFETDDGWVIINIRGNACEIKADKDNVRTDKKCLKFWDDNDFEFTAEQHVKINGGSHFTFGGFFEGGDCGDTAEIKIGISADGGETFTEATTKDAGWKQWQNPEIADFLADNNADGEREIIVKITVKAKAGGWGAWDDMYLYESEGK